MIPLQLKFGEVKVSIAHHQYAYCTPRADNAEYTAVEVGLWTKPTEELAGYADGSVNPDGELTVYAYVPVEVLARYLATLSTEVN